MKFYPTIEETLNSHFTEGEWCDITNHGANTGISGFTFTWEITNFFNEFENEIEDFFYDIYGSTWVKDSGMADCDDFDGMRAFAVWSVVEMWASNKVDEMEEKENDLQFGSEYESGINYDKFETVELGA